MSEDPTGAAYRMRPLQPADLALVSQWRAQPHVRRWWGDPGVEPEWEKLRDPRQALWIVELDRRPLGFIQDYDVHGWSPHPFDYLPPGSRGMDVFIGDPEALGQGHGAAFIRAHVDGLFRAGAPAVGIDPHPDNSAARRAFEKAGFSRVSGPVKTPWGTAVLMERWAAGRPT